MKVQYIQEFISLVQVGNFTQTAHELNTTESTLSRHIKAMEKELKQALFTRTSRRTELTEFGQEFLIYAKNIVDIWEECSVNLLEKPPLMK